MRMMRMPADTHACSGAACSEAGLRSRRKPPLGTSADSTPGGDGGAACIHFHTPRCTSGCTLRARGQPPRAGSAPNGGDDLCEVEFAAERLSNLLRPR